MTDRRTVFIVRDDKSHVRYALFRRRQAMQAIKGRKGWSVEEAVGVLTDAAARVIHGAPVPDLWLDSL